MSNEIAKQDFPQEQVELIKRTLAKDATDDELKLFLHQCKRTGLDPLSRQIYFMKRGGKVTIQTSIDGFRAIAERSGDYAGQDEPVYEKDGDDLFCKVTVYRFRGDIRYPAAVGKAYWKEYVPQAGQDFMWKKMPRTMLAKVAEALALRKAYPQDLSGLYTGDEMEQSGNVAPVKTEPKIASNVSTEDRHFLYDLMRRADIPPDEREMWEATIGLCSNYDEYQKIQYQLEDMQQSFETIPNPNQTDIKKHLRKTVKQ